MLIGKRKIDTSSKIIAFKTRQSCHWKVEATEKDETNFWLNNTHLKRTQENIKWLKKRKKMNHFLDE